MRKVHLRTSCHFTLKSRKYASVSITCFLLNIAPLIKETGLFQHLISFLSPTNLSRGIFYLLQVLHDGCEPLIFCLHVSDHSPALLQFVLHLQDLPQVVSFLRGGLLQKRLLPGLSILSNFPVDGEGLAKGLQGI